MLGSAQCGGRTCVSVVVLRRRPDKRSSVEGVTATVTGAVMGAPSLLQRMASLAVVTVTMPSVALASLPLAADPVSLALAVGCTLSLAVAVVPPLPLLLLVFGGPALLVGLLLRVPVKGSRQEQVIFVTKIIVNKRGKQTNE